MLKFGSRTFRFHFRPSPRHCLDAPLPFTLEETLRAAQARFASLSDVLDLQAIGIEQENHALEPDASRALPEACRLAREEIQGLLAHLPPNVPNWSGGHGLASSNRLMRATVRRHVSSSAMIPHFTGPIAEAALVHCLTATSVTALMEMLVDGSRTYPHLPQAYDFREGKMWPNDRPGRNQHHGQG